MIRPKTCFVATGITRDAETGTISAYNIFEGIRAAGLPVFIQSLSFLAFWERDLTDDPNYAGTFTVAIGEQTLVTNAVAVNFGDKTKHRSIVNVNGLVVPTVGQLTFAIVLDNGVRSEYTIVVEGPPVNVQAQA
jgi:hypothetical protein